MSNHDQARLAVFEEILNEFRGVNSAAQRRRFKAALLRLGSVLTFELSRFLDIYNSPARKHELLHGEGWDIVMTKEPVATESGDKHRLGRYTLRAMPKELVI